MKKNGFILSVWLVLTFWGCSSIYVKSDYDHDIDFSQYTTFKWMPSPKKRSKNLVRKGSLLDKRIRRAVEQELEAKGFEIKRTGRADAMLAYHVNIQKRVEVSPARYGYYGWRRGHVHHYKQGSIIIDVVDPRLNQLIWRGAAVGAVGKPDVSQEKISEAMTKVFEKYPPQS